MNPDFRLSKGGLFDIDSGIVEPIEGCYHFIPLEYRYFRSEVFLTDSTIAHFGTVQFHEGKAGSEAWTFNRLRVSVSLQALRWDRCGLRSGRP